MTDDPTPETVDEETPDAGEGEPETVAETAARGEASATREGVDDDEGAARGDDSTDSDADDAPAEAAAADTTADPATQTERVPDPDTPDDVDDSATADSATTAANPASDAPEDGSGSKAPDPEAGQAVPEDVRKYARFQKMDGAQYDRVNEFLRDRTYVTAREWAIARLCADFRTETGVEMTKIGKNLPRLVPFMTDTYTPQAVNQARASFEEKVNKAGATFLYGAMSGFFTAEELDEMMYEVTEVAKFLLEVEGVDLSVEEELAAEDEISEVMREVRQSSAQVRGEEVECPECGHVHDPN